MIYSNLLTIFCSVSDIVIDKIFCCERLWSRADRARPEKAAEALYLNFRLGVGDVNDAGLEAGEEWDMEKGLRSECIRRHSLVFRAISINGSDW